jgi:acetylornithine deacetylase
MDRERLTKLVADLVAIPSINPLEGPLTEGRGEAQLAAFVHSYLQEAGIECELRDALPGRPNVVARLPGASEEAVWFDAHLDTVSAEGMQFEPFAARIEGDQLFGRGSADDKGSLAAMIAALLEVAASGTPPPATILLTATADEEHQMTGLRTLLDSGLQARAAIVGEPTGLEIITAHKGVCRFQITTRGKAVHSSRPEEGVNAIYRMASIVQALEAYAKGGVGSGAHPLLGRATLSVGVIRGGEYVNVVPDSCLIDVDRRLLPGEEGRPAVIDVRTYLTNVADEGLDFEVSDPLLLVPGLDIRGDDPLVQAAAAAIKQVTGKAHLNGMTGTTHAGPLTEAGIPSLVVGPGAMGQAHTATEQLDLTQVEQAAAIYQALMLSGAT